MYVHRRTYNVRDFCVKSKYHELFVQFNNTRTNMHRYDLGKWMVLVEGVRGKKKIKNWTLLTGNLTYLARNEPKILSLFIKARLNRYLEIGLFYGECITLGTCSVHITFQFSFFCFAFVLRTLPPTFDDFECHSKIV